MMKKLQPGEHLEGRYRIERLIASGGQAHVYKGVHIGLERPVAIKLLRNHGSPDVKARMVKRFEQEAKLISKLKDPHTITLYDFGRLEDGALFMVFEYVDGISLKQLIKQFSPIEPSRVAKILRQTLSSLHEAHTMGVLHRDLKPANIMVYDHVGRKDQVKLLDFGIAKILSGDSSLEALEGLTGNNLVGTPRYIAPEVYQSSNLLGPQSDIYSLGLVAYELLLGEPAIKGNSAIDVFRQQFNTHSIKLPASLDIPEGLRKVLNTMLERDMPRRYQRCEQVLWDLRSWQKNTLVNQLQQDIDDSLDFDPQDLDIPDPYDDVAPTQNVSSDILSSIPGLAAIDSASIQADTISDIGDSGEFLRQSHPRHRHTPSHGISAAYPPHEDPVDMTTDDMDADLPTQVSSLIYEAVPQNAPPRMQQERDSRTDVIPGIIPAELFAQSLQVPDFTGEFTGEYGEGSLHEETEFTAEIHLSEQLQRDIERARQLRQQQEQPRPPKKDLDNDVTEAIRKPRLRGRYETQPPIKRPYKHNND